MGKWTGVVTNGGSALLSNWISGTLLNFTGSTAGTGTVAAVALLAQTALVSQKQTASITGYEKVTKGIKLRIQITAPQTGYTLNQFGVWAKLDSGTSTLLALFQNEEGVPIPSYADSPDFVYTFYGIVSVDNTGTFTVTIDASALATMENVETAIKKHSENKQNPHEVTKGQVGLGNVPNVATNDQTPTYTAATTLATLTSGEKLSVSMGKIMKAISDLISHIGNKQNPHEVTKGQVGLGNVPNVATNDQTPTYTAATTLATLTSGEKLSVAMGKIAKAIADLISHIADTTKHITAAERTAWNAKPTTANVNTAIGTHNQAADAHSDIRQAVSGKASPSDVDTKISTHNTASGAHSTLFNQKAAAADLTAHTENATVHITAAERTAWNGKAAGSHTHDDRYLQLTGGTLTGNLTGKYITGTWLQAASVADLSRAAGKVAVLDDSGWVYYRTVAELLADLGIPDAASIRATTAVYGTTILSTSITSTSKTTAATPYAVKAALDNAKQYTDTAIGNAIAASY